jgi:predicted secreted protein
LEVWSKFSNTHQNIVQVVVTAADLNDWWRTLNAGLKVDVVKDVTMAGYVAWNIWKERNQRIFQDKRASAISVAGPAKTEVALYISAHRLF